MGYIRLILDESKGTIIQGGNIEKYCLNKVPENYYGKINIKENDATCKENN